MKYLVKSWNLFGLIPVLGLMFGCGKESSVSSPSPASRSPIPRTNMVLIRAGTFQRIQFPVTLSRDFWIGKYEVTQGEFQTVMGLNPSHFTGLSNHPVEKVSFVAASNYCVKVTAQERDQGRLPEGFEYRLPTEAEWEYACRAGSTHRFYFGPTLEGGDAHAWTAENCEATTHPVGAKQPNAWGLHDMHGNVWEWCSSKSANYPYRADDGREEVGGTVGRVLRGGGWGNIPEACRSAYRRGGSPNYGDSNGGFRVVLDF